MGSAETGERDREDPAPLEHDDSGAAAAEGGPGEAPEPSQRAPEPGSSDLSLPRWESLEVSWPLALAAGFVGAWIGTRSGIPGAPELAASALFGPLFLAHVLRGRAVLAGLLSVGWVVALGAALMGSVYEAGWLELSRVLPLAEWFLEVSVRPLLADPAQGISWRSVAVLWTLVLVTALAARLSRGILALPLLAAGAGAIAGAGAWVAVRVETAGDPLFAALTAVPPHVLLPLVGAALLAAGTADPPRGLDELDRPGQSLRMGGLGIALLGGLFAPTVARLWAQSAGS